MRTSRGAQDRRPIDHIRARVFVVSLPGMTHQRERLFIAHCRRLARTAMAAGVPMGVAWGLISQRIERLAPRLRTEHERETFLAIMHRLRHELFQDVAVASR
ncbi:hypothetical protein [Paludisphaera rhizosphaerae]|uniref:hypothetical protein n=1 Tax=Paludisphaera rhizosphaerae TaxID=2711216 RepID=UPI0013EDB3F9|nr:hypothetical protein [Paludisphaera rhizosphaerae]